MKEKLKNKKMVYYIIGIISVLLVAAAVTYAYWLVTKTQEGENLITSRCLDIELVGKNDIMLQNQFPLSDTDGIKLTPYEFTVTNQCKTTVDYQVNLEFFDVEDKEEIEESALKVAINLKGATEINGTKLSNKTETTTTIKNAYESRNLISGTLAGKSDETTNDEVTYELRIWIAEDANISEMNKSFRSKVSVTVGGGINNALKKGTLAYDIVSKYNENNEIGAISADEYVYKESYSDEVYIGDRYDNYYGTEYTYDEQKGVFTLSGTLTEAKLSECRTGTKNCGKYTLNRSTADSQYSVIYEITDFQTSGNRVIANRFWYTLPFESSTSIDEYGLFTAQDDLGISYYFRGNVSDNRVKFGVWGEDAPIVGYQYDESENEKYPYVYDSMEKCESVSYMDECISLVGKPMYWRIVRINGDGSIRLVYDGYLSEEVGNSHNNIIGNSKFNPDSDKKEYVGYTYDTTDSEGNLLYNSDGTIKQTDSTIKSVVDAWYENNLKENYGKYIVDGIFCNDREIVDISYEDSDFNKTTDENAFRTVYIYGIRNRLSNPKLICTRDEDKYTTGYEMGNGLLKYPVGLLTADEVMMAGATNRDSNLTFFLYTPDEGFFTMTPDFMGSNLNYETGDTYIRVFYHNMITGGYEEGFGATSYGYGVRPVINLDGNLKFKGNGEIGSEYEIVTE